jgi:hypothetical protein
MKRALTDKDTILPEAKRTHIQVVPIPVEFVPRGAKFFYRCMILTTGPVSSDELPCQF